MRKIYLNFLFICLGSHSSSSGVEALKGKLKMDSLGSKPFRFLKNVNAFCYQAFASCKRKAHLNERVCEQCISRLFHAHVCFQLIPESKIPNGPSVIFIRAAMQKSESACGNYINTRR